MSEHNSSSCLRNAVSIVTGAGSGLGAAYAKEIARQGGAVVINDYDPERMQSIVDEIRRGGGRSIGVEGSVADESVAQRMVDVAVNEYGKLTGLVNNAGIFQQSEPSEITAAGAQRVFEVNLLGAMLCGAAAVPALGESGGGAIVNVASGSALGMRHQSVYATSKGGVLSMTYSWALDLAEANIRVNAISPRAYTSMIQSSEVTRATVSQTERPDAVSPLVSFLLSPAAQGITGQCFRFDQGKISVMRPPRLGEPIAHSDRWTVQGLADVFGAGEHLEPYGLGSGE